MTALIKDEFGNERLAKRYDDDDYDGPRAPHSGFIEGCPECGEPVPAHGGPVHARLHWPDHIADEPAHREAIRRRAYLVSHFA